MVAVIPHRLAVGGLETLTRVRPTKGDLVTARAVLLHVLVAALPTAMIGHTSTDRTEGPHARNPIRREDGLSHGGEAPTVTSDHPAELLTLFFARLTSARDRLTLATQGREKQVEGALGATSRMNVHGNLPWRIAA